MKNYLRLLCGLLTLCLLAAPVSPAARAAETGRTITLEAGKVDMRTALKDAQDGDTIVLDGSVGITDMTSKDAPWVIDKAVTIQGGTLGLWAGGIILDADVTFRDTTLAFDLYVRNAIMANGHTLTLENVTCSSRSVNLFCGGLYDPEGFGSTPGAAGAIVIKGNTSLKGDSAPGNLYAGNLCMGGMNEADSHINGPANQYNGSASIRIESGSATLGDIYAGGAQQRIPVGSTSGKVILTNPAEYTTAGPVDVRLTDGAVKTVDGAGAGKVNVTYNGGAYSTDLTVKNISSLRVESGTLAPAAESGLPTDAALSVREGAKLDLTKLGDVTAGSLEGGGTLVLGQSQSLTVTGNVTGSTTVGIGSLNPSGHSTMQPIAEHPYLRAPQSGTDAFLLVPPDGYPDTQFTRADNGDWSVPAGDISVLAKTFRFESDNTSIPIGEPCDLPMEVLDGNDEFMYIDDVPVTILVNGSQANKQQDMFGDDVYVTPDNKLSIYLADNTLSVTAAEEDRIYTIQVVIPGEHTATGQPLSARTVLTVGTPTPPAVLVESIGFAPDQPSPVSGEYAQMGLAVTYADNGVSEPTLASLPLTVTVNGASAARQETDGGCVYTTPDNKLSIQVTGNEIGVIGEKGTYTIELTVPGEHTATGQPLSADTTLNITDAVVPPPPPSLSYQIQSVSADNAQVTVDVSALTADATPGATVLAAAYTQDGMMCAVSLVPMTAAGTVLVPLDSTGADYVTVFIVDGTGTLKPLCQNQSAAK